jgi:hypothetical protein
MPHLVGEMYVVTQLDWPERVLHLNTLELPICRQYLDSMSDMVRLMPHTRILHHGAVHCTLCSCVASRHGAANIICSYHRMYSFSFRVSCSCNLHNAPNYQAPRLRYLTLLIAARRRLAHGLIMITRARAHLPPASAGSRCPLSPAYMMSVKAPALQLNFIHAS